MTTRRGASSLLDGTAYLVCERSLTNGQRISILPMMSLDLDNLLKDWPHEPGQIKVRKIAGDDGAEKLQMRLDLGLIQMKMTGRPDGLRPFDCESLLEYHRAKADERLAAGEAYVLSDEECTD